MVPKARRASTRPGDGGETLIEVLVSVVLLGTAVIGVLAGLLTTTDTSTRATSVSQIGLATQNMVEQLQQPVNANPGDNYEYRPCATASGGGNAYGPITTTVGQTYAMTIVQVRYATAITPPSAGTPGSVTWGSTCPSPDLGLQELTVKVESSNSAKPDTEYLTIVKRDAKCTRRYSAAYQNADQGPC